MTWMQIEGGVWDFARPESRAVSWPQIARGLARIPRYNGRGMGRVSVAEHCVLIARWLLAQGHGPTVALAGLLHDAGEAYYGDMIGPVQAALKAASPSGHQALKALQARTDAAIADAAGLSVADLKHPAVKEADLRILRDERVVVFESPMVRPWGEIERLTPLYVIVQGWAEPEAAAAWLELYHELQRLRDGGDPSPPACPFCSAPEVPSKGPRTYYACGSSDYDQRDGTFKRTAECRSAASGAAAS